MEYIRPVSPTFVNKISCRKLVTELTSVAQACVKPAKETRYLYSTYMFLETNSFLNSSNELVILSTSAMCSSRHCGEKQLSRQGRTGQQFVVHVYIRRYGKWTETNGSVFFLPATLKRTNLRLSPDFNRRLKTLLLRVNCKTETAQTRFSTKTHSATRWHYSVYPF